MSDPLLTTALIIAAYLLGSVCTAIPVCRLLRHPDPRTEGSRNPGATNVMRVAGRTPAAITLAGDLLKGLTPVALARLLSDDPLAWMLAGLAAFLGHLYPAFHGLRGGKGVAIALGVLLALAPTAAGLTIAIWLITFAITRISAVSALAAFLLAPVWVALVLPSLAVIALVGIMSGLLFWRHRGNIQQLLRRG